jgi:hypothetical protein
MSTITADFQAVSPIQIVVSASCSFNLNLLGNFIPILKYERMMSAERVVTDGSKMTFDSNINSIHC